MSKAKKKRNKTYQGEDARPLGSPTVTRYTATVRSPIGEWWLEHKRAIKISAGIVAGAGIVIWALIELIGLLT